MTRNAITADEVRRTEDALVAASLVEDMIALYSAGEYSEGDFMTTKEFFAREERNDPPYYRLFKSFMRGSYEGASTRLRLTSSIARLFSGLPGVWLNAPPKADAASLWAGAHNSFLKADRALGFKREMWSSLRSGSMFSLFGGVIVPTGTRSRGFG